MKSARLLLIQRNHYQVHMPYMHITDSLIGPILNCSKLIILRAEGDSVIMLILQSLGAHSKDTPKHDRQYIMTEETGYHRIYDLALGRSRIRMGMSVVNGIISELTRTHRKSERKQLDPSNLSGSL